MSRIPAKKLFATVLLAAVCVGGILLVRVMRPDPSEVLKRRMAERSMGAEKAPVWITEYFDYQCPPCAIAAKTLKEAITQKPDRYFLQARYYPLPAHKNALKAAVYAECVSRQKGRFWAFHEAVFEHQKDWAKDPYPQIHFARYAEAAGADLHALDACVSDPKVQEAVEEEKKKGSDLGVQITPSFFVNGKLVVGNQALKQELEQAAEVPHEA